jgi:hypothetical protein
MRPKNMWIRWIRIRIRNTGLHSFQLVQPAVVQGGGGGVVPKGFQLGHGGPTALVRLGGEKRDEVLEGEGPIKSLLYTIKF